MEIKDQLEQILVEVKAAKDQAKAQEEKFGTVATDLKAKLEALQKQADALDVKLAERHAATQPDESVVDFIKNNEQLAKLMRDKSGTAVLTLNAKHLAQMERKTTVSESAVGFATSGVLLPDRLPGITPEARQRLLLRDVLVTRPTTMAFIDFIKVNAAPANASPQTEASDKGENAVTFTTASEKVRTLATWIPATKQVLDDMTELMAYIMDALPYKVNQLEEIQMLSGAGTDPNLNGLITQATAFQTSLLSSAAGWNRIDIVGRAIQQVTAAKEFQQTFIVVHPTDWWAMRLTKDSYGRYIMGDPQTSVGSAATGGTVSGGPRLFDLTPVVTTSIASGTFLVGSGDPNCTIIRDRMDMQVEIATQHSDYFSKNLIAIRAEKRMALVTRRPASFITGTFNTSPVVAGQ